MRPPPIISLTEPENGEASLGGHDRIGKTIRNARANPHKTRIPGSLKSLVDIQLLTACKSAAATERLASRAEVCAPVLHDDSLDGTSANGAEFTTPVSNLEIEMGCAQFSLGANIRVNAGAFVPDGCLKNSAGTVM
jgi:hypothetical protein